MKISRASIAAIFLMTSLSLQADFQEIYEYPLIEGGPLVSIDYLYWRISEDQLYPAILIDQSVDEDGLNISDIALKNQKFKSTSGFRAALGYQLPYEEYDIKFAWTRLHPKTTIGYSSPEGLITLSFFDQTNSDVPEAGSLVSQWRLNYDMLDLELGREFMVGNRFSLRPNVGLKGGWIDQTQTIQVNDIILNKQAPIELVQGTVNRKNNFNGIGPRLGVDLRFAFESELGVFGSVSGALLYGKFDLKTETFISNTMNGDGSSLTGPQLTTISHSNCFLSPTVQILLGADWVGCFCQKYLIRLGAAYEVQLWWNQIRSNNSIVQVLFANSPSGGDLMMQGLTLQASLEF